MCRENKKKSNPLAFVRLSVLRRKEFAFCSFAVSTFGLCNRANWFRDYQIKIRSKTPIKANCREMLVFDVLIIALKKINCKNKIKLF